MSSMKLLLITTVVGQGCTANCYAGTCDYWDGGYWGTCSSLQSGYGCNCDGCECDGCPQGQRDESGKCVAPFNPAECPNAGNGKCDPSDNTDECAWDGNDCCEQTCVGTLCGTQGYDCKNPQYNPGSQMANGVETSASSSEEVEPEAEEPEADEDEWWVVKEAEKAAREDAEAAALEVEKDTTAPEDEAETTGKPAAPVVALQAETLDEASLDEALEATWWDMGWWVLAFWVALVFTCVLFKRTSPESRAVAPMADVKDTVVDVKLTLDDDCASTATPGSLDYADSVVGDITDMPRDLSV